MARGSKTSPSCLQKLFLCRKFQNVGNQVVKIGVKFSPLSFLWLTLSDPGGSFWLLPCSLIRLSMGQCFEQGCCCDPKYSLHVDVINTSKILSAPGTFSSHTPFFLSNLSSHSPLLFHSQWCPILNFINLSTPLGPVLGLLNRSLPRQSSCHGLASCWWNIWHHHPWFWRVFVCTQQLNLSVVTT